MGTKCGMCVCLKLLVLFRLVVVTDAPCHCCKDGTCQPTECGGNCKDGYHGGKCLNRCPKGCVRCVDAPQGGGVAYCTQCIHGFYSTPTNYQCQLSCSDGYYITTSNQCVKCNETCLKCSSATFCITCTRGYYKELDTGKCRKCSYGCFRELCAVGNGVCLDCKLNFTQGPLGTCDTCVDGMYGYQCNNSCSKNCVSTCDRISGLCTTCKHGFHGDYCDEACPGNCVSTCNRTTGDCFACTEAYCGDECTLECQNNCRECTITEGTCTICVDGYYGDTCDKNCSDNCLINKCSKTNGSCACAHGYGGDTCDMKLTTTEMPSSPRDGLPLVVTPIPENYVEEFIGITLAGVVVLAGVIGGAIVMYRCRKRNLLSESLPVVIFKAETRDEAKLKAELESLDQKMATLDAKTATIRERRAAVEAQIQELDRHVPYRHTDRADVIQEENAYEMLQQQKQDEQGHYMMIKY